MDRKGVITGDIVNSSALNVEAKKLLIGSIWQITDELKHLSPLDISVYRGDSFQIIVDKPEKTLQIAILIRAGLKGKTTETSEVLWDARISIGIGTISYIDEHLPASDGEAFILSGHGLDNIGKKRLAISTGDANADEEFAVSTSFADDIITGWTPAQAQLVWLALVRNTSQKEIAAEKETSIQNVSKLLTTAKVSLIELYINRFVSVIESL